MEEFYYLLLGGVIISYEALIFETEILVESMGLFEEFRLLLGYSGLIVLLDVVVLLSFSLLVILADNDEF